MKNTYSGDYRRPYFFIVVLFTALILGLIGGHIGIDTPPARKGIVVFVLLVLGIIIGIFEIHRDHVVIFSALAAIFILSSTSVDVNALGNFIEGADTVLRRTLNFIAIFTASVSISLSLKACLFMGRSD